MRWRARKPITIIPGILRMNVSSAAGGGRKSAGGVSFTWHIGKYASYNTKRGAATINTPGLGSVTTSTKTQRKKRREEKAMWRFADAEYDRQYFLDVQAGRTPDMNGKPSTRGLRTPPPRYRKGWQAKPTAQPNAYCGRCGASLTGGACPNCPPINQQRQGHRSQTGSPCGSRRTTTGKPCQQPVAAGGKCRFHP